MVGLAITKRCENEWRNRSWTLQSGISFASQDKNTFVVEHATSASPGATVWVYKEVAAWRCSTRASGQIPPQCTILWTGKGGETHRAVFEGHRKAIRRGRRHVAQGQPAERGPDELEDL